MLIRQNLKLRDQMQLLLMRGLTEFLSLKMHLLSIITFYAMAMTIQWKLKNWDTNILEAQINSEFKNLLLIKVTKGWTTSKKYFYEIWILYASCEFAFFK